MAILAITSLRLRTRATPVVLATALAPWAGAALADVLGGYPAVFVVLAAVALVAAGCAVGSVPRTAR